MCGSPREWVGGAGDRLHLGFARVFHVIYGSGAALCMTQVLSAQMLGLGVDSIEGVGKGDSQLSVSQLQPGGAGSGFLPSAVIAGAV